MRPYGTPKNLEKRRNRAIALLKSGRTYRETAAKLGSSLSSVVRWRQSYRKKGPDGLRSKPVSGRPPRLSKAKKRKLLRLLVKGPLEAGHSTNLWTLKRIAKVIERHFGARYSLCGAWKLMTALEWSPQKPERRAIERDEEAIARWKRCVWPHIKKSPKA